MPSWNIHLEAGNRLADKLKFKGKARQEFLLGCLLPDINNGYINKVSTKKEHGETHYAYNQRSSLNFYAENKDEIDRKDPIFLGYLFHLYTDGFFNYDFYRTIKRHPLGEGLSHLEKQKIKHHDFWVYDTNFRHHLDYTPSDLERLTSYANQINATDITPEDIENIEQILTDEAFGENMKGEKYQFYTKKRLDDLMDDMIDSFSHDYLGEDYA